MKERPILFSAPMVRALLYESKTQTRRIVKRFEVRDGMPEPEWSSLLKCCPYGQPGDRLWVRETWGVLYDCFLQDTDEPTFWRADYQYKDLAEQLLPKWRPSIHMPRTRSRIMLEITGVRVERLQDISEADAMAEGARECDLVSGREVLLAGPSQRGSFVLHYRDIWEQINGPGSWDANPWVWVVEFKRAEGGAA